MACNKGGACVVGQVAVAGRVALWQLEGRLPEARFELWRYLLGINGRFGKMQSAVGGGRAHTQRLCLVLVAGPPIVVFLALRTRGAPSSFDFLKKKTCRAQ